MESQIRIQTEMGDNVRGDNVRGDNVRGDNVRGEKEKENEKAREKIIKKEQKLVTKEMLDAYMEKNPYIYQEKPPEYAYLSYKEWRENDEWADRAAKLMLLSKSMRK